MSLTSVSLGFFACDETMANCSKTFPVCIIEIVELTLEEPRPVSIPHPQILHTTLTDEIEPFERTSEKYELDHRSSQELIQDGEKFIGIYFSYSFQLQ